MLDTPIAAHAISRLLMPDTLLAAYHAADYALFSLPPYVIAAAADDMMPVTPLYCHADAADTCYSAAFRA